MILKENPNQPLHDPRRSGYLRLRRSGSYLSGSSFPKERYTMTTATGNDGKASVSLLLLSIRVCSSSPEGFWVDGSSVGMKAKQNVEQVIDGILVLSNYRITV